MSKKTRPKDIAINILDLFHRKIKSRATRTCIDEVVGEISSKTFITVEQDRFFNMNESAWDFCADINKNEED
jgi:hypothetical protein